MEAAAETVGLLLARLQGTGARDRVAMRLEIADKVKDRWPSSRF